MISNNVRGNRLDRLKEEFTELKPQVTQEIIALAIVKTGDSDSTIRRYLRGDVKKLAAGTRILNCLKDLVKKHAA